MYNTTVNISVLWTWFYFFWVCTQEWNYLIMWYLHKFWRNWQTVFQSGWTIYGVSIHLFLLLQNTAWFQHSFTLWSHCIYFYPHFFTSTLTKHTHTLTHGYMHTFSRRGIKRCLNFPSQEAAWCNGELPHYVSENMSFNSDSILVSCWIQTRHWSCVSSSFLM